MNRFAEIQRTHLKSSSSTTSSSPKSSSSWSSPAMQSSVKYILMFRFRVHSSREVIISEMKTWTCKLNNPPFSPPSISLSFLFILFFSPSLCLFVCLCITIITTSTQRFLETKCDVEFARKASVYVVCKACCTCYMCVVRVIRVYVLYMCTCYTCICVIRVYVLYVYMCYMSVRVIYVYVIYVIRVLYVHTEDFYLEEQLREKLELNPYLFRDL